MSSVKKVVKDFAVVVFFGGLIYINIVIWSVIL